MPYYTDPFRTVTALITSTDFDYYTYIEKVLGLKYCSKLDYIKSRINKFNKRFEYHLLKAEFYLGGKPIEDSVYQCLEYNYKGYYDDNYNYIDKDLSPDELNFYIDTPLLDKEIRNSDYYYDLDEYVYGYLLLKKGDDIKEIKEQLRESANHRVEYHLLMAEYYLTDCPIEILIYNYINQNEKYLETTCDLRSDIQFCYKKIIDCYINEYLKLDHTSSLKDIKYGLKVSENNDLGFYLLKAEHSFGGDPIEVFIKKYLESNVNKTDIFKNLRDRIRYSSNCLDEYIYNYLKLCDGASLDEINSKMSEFNNNSIAYYLLISICYTSGSPIEISILNFLNPNMVK